MGREGREDECVEEGEGWKKGNGGSVVRMLVGVEGGSGKSLLVKTFVESWKGRRTEVIAAKGAVVVASELEKGSNCWKDGDVGWMAKRTTEVEVLRKEQRRLGCEWWFCN